MSTLEEPDSMCPFCRQPCKSYEPYPKSRDSKFYMESKIRVNCERCGEYKIGVQLYHDTKDELSILSGLTDKYKGKEYILSGVTRNASEGGNPIEINSENIANLIDFAPIPTTPLEILDKVLLYIYSKSQSFDFTFLLNPNLDYPLFYAKNKNELKYVLSNPEYQGYLNFGSSNRGNTLEVRPVGWERVNELRRKRPDSNQVFVAMWFNDDMKDAYTNGIKPALEETGYKPYRVDDDLSNNDMIVNKIIAEIRKSTFLIADLTGIRRSVIFEAGFAKGLDIEVIWTCSQKCKVYMKKNNIKLPFDVSQFPVLFWETPEKLKEILIDKIGYLGLDIGRGR